MWAFNCSQYAGTVMISLCFPQLTRANWLKKNTAWIEWSRRWYGNFCVGYQWEKIWHFSGRFDKHLSLYCSAVKLKLQMRPGYCFFWVLWDHTDNFGIASSKMHLKAVTILIPIEITRRKKVCSFCLKPMSMETWRLHTVHYDVSLYQHIFYKWNHLPHFVDRFSAWAPFWQARSALDENNLWYHEKLRKVNAREKEFITWMWSATSRKPITPDQHAAFSAPLYTRSYS